MVRESRNPMQHYNILDLEFPLKFAEVSTHPKLTFMRARRMGFGMQLSIAHEVLSDN